MRIEKPLAAGDTLEIDTETLEVKLNGAVVKGYIAGDVFDLNGGTNTIVYTDGESSRAMKIEISYQPRYL